jgi:hypothetical protein
MNTFKVLSIDAWGNADDGYDWNQWFNAGHVDIDLNADNLTILQTMEKEGFITNANLADIDDDGYNLVIVDYHSRQPIFAIEYGSTL